MVAAGVMGTSETEDRTTTPPCLGWVKSEWDFEASQTLVDQSANSVVGSRFKPYVRCSPHSRGSINIHFKDGKEANRTTTEMAASVMATAGVFRSGEAAGWGRSVCLQPYVGRTKKIKFLPVKEQSDFPSLKAEEIEKRSIRDGQANFQQNFGFWGFCDVGFEDLTITFRNCKHCVSHHLQF